MKYCAHCGKEILDDAVVCINCGVPVVEENRLVKAKKPKPKAKIVIISVLGVVLVAAAIFGIVFLPKIVKANKIEKALVGETLSYTKTYYYLGCYDKYEYEFYEDNKARRTYYYSNIDKGGDFSSVDYKVKVISDDEILLIFGKGGKNNEFLLELNYDGSVKSMTNTNDSEEVYD